MYLQRACAKVGEKDSCCRIELWKESRGWLKFNTHQKRGPKHDKLIDVRGEVTKSTLNVSWEEMGLLHGHKQLELRGMMECFAHSCVTDWGPWLICVDRDGFGQKGEDYPQMYIYHDELPYALHVFYSVLSFPYCCLYSLLSFPYAASTHCCRFHMLPLLIVVISIMLSLDAPVSVSGAAYLAFAAIVILSCTSWCVSAV